MPKVLISDVLDNVCINILKDNKIDVDVITNLNNEELKKIILKFM